MNLEFENIDYRIQQLIALKNLVMEISRIRDLDDLFWQIANKVPKLLEAEDCAILLLDPETALLSFRTSKTRNVGVTILPNTVSILMSVLKTRQTRRTMDARSEPDYNNEVAEKAGIFPKSLIAAPILLNGNAIGVVEVINKREGEFTEADEEIVCAIATHIAASVENSWLNEASERRLRELSILVEISKAISTAYDLDTLFENISKVITETTRLNEFAVSEWDKKNNQVVTLLDCINCDQKQAEKMKGTIYPLDKFPVTREVLEKKKIRVIDVEDPGADENEVQILLKRDRTIIMIIPMIARNDTTGILEIYFSKDHPHWQNSTRLYQSIANQIGAAIENTRLHEEARNHALMLEKRVHDRTAELEALAKSERSQRQLAETLREAGAIVASTLDPGSAINEILNQLSRVVPHDSASVQLLNEDELVIVAGGGWLEHEKMQGYRFPIPGPNPNTEVLTSQSPLILNEKELLMYAEFQRATHGAIRSWLGVPLITQDMTIGMLTLDSTQNGYFKEEHAVLASAFGDQVAVALEQAILFQKTQSALNERDALRAIMVEIASELDLQKLMNTVMLNTCGLLEATSAEIGLYDSDQEVVEIVALHNQSEDFIGMQIPVGIGLAGQVAMKREAIMLSDYAAWEHRISDYDNSVWHGAIAAPLMHRQRLIGVIAVGDKRKTRSFSASDVELLTMLANQVAIAIENAQLFQKVQALATTDELTGLLNRRELFRIGNEIFELSKREDIPVSTIMFDIDLFKRINDTYGHSTGDQVLAELAALCKEHIRDQDILCRYGGEEFTVVLPGTDQATAQVIAERLRRTVEATPLHTDRGDLLITVSFGVSSLKKDHASMAVLVDEADAAMYLAKNMGRNRVEGYTKAKG